MRLRRPLFLAVAVAVALALAAAAAPASAQPDAGPEPRSNYARAELAFVETLNGFTVGAYICGIAECDGARPWVASLMLGTGAGLAGSLLATGDGITGGEAQLVETGTIWGAWNGIALAGLAGYYDHDDAKAALGLILAGQLGGTAAGALATRFIHPTGGQVALAGSVGAWAGIESGLLLGALNVDEPRADWAVLLAASDVGLVAGSLIADRYPMSRGRSLLINVGAAAGGLGGAGIAVLIGGNDVSRELGFGSVVVGSVVGLAVTTLLTRNWDYRGPTPQLSVAPTKGGAVGSLSMTF